MCADADSRRDSRRRVRGLIVIVLGLAAVDLWGQGVELGVRAGLSFLENAESDVAARNDATASVALSGGLFQGPLAFAVETGVSFPGDGPGSRPAWNLAAHLALSPDISSVLVPFVEVGFGLAVWRERVGLHPSVGAGLGLSQRRDSGPFVRLGLRYRPLSFDPPFDAADSYGVNRLEVGLKAGVKVAR